MRGRRCVVLRHGFCAETAAQLAGRPTPVSAELSAEPLSLCHAGCIIFLLGRVQLQWTKVCRGACRRIDVCLLEATMAAAAASGGCCPSAAEARPQLAVSSTQLRSLFTPAN